MLSSSFKLNHLEKNDSLWCCPTSDGKQFWLSIGADASVLQSELNSPVYDWKISVNAPLKLENRLPCPAQFTIWEKLSNENTSERQRGLILSRGIVPIYHADVRNPLFLSLSLQGGWKLEKIRSEDPPSFLMLVRPWDQADFDWWVVCSQLEGCLILKVLMLLQSSSGFVMLAIFEFNYCGYIGRGKQGSCLAAEIFLLGGAFLVFPSSFSIKASSLGNLGISDDSLGSSHMNFWKCRWKFHLWSFHCFGDTIGVLGGAGRQSDLDLHESTTYLATGVDLDESTNEVHKLIESTTEVVIVDHVFKEESTEVV
ncbi:hypothetical protein Tco_0624372 [Tanacetum coccineum]|uniref:Vacuolar protein sorting-associated protein 13 VPS13 adaptor binding domain-containing protein n=1 Tax=Tanacetum coccineum TaxID=301880 RepID=A0ABQ4WDW3_9ASTR